MKQADIDEILARSANGEGVVNVMREKGMDIDAGLEYLKRHHHDDLKVAKKVAIDKIEKAKEKDVK